MRTDGLKTSKQEYQALDLAKFQPSGKKADSDEVQYGDVICNVNHNENVGQKAQTYVEAVQKFPLHTKQWKA